MQPRFKRLGVVLTGAAVATVAVAGMAMAAVTNGGFEDGTTSGWTASPAAGAGAITVLNDGTAPEGSFYARLVPGNAGSDTILSQQISTGNQGVMLTGFAAYRDIEAAAGQPCQYVDPARVEVLDAANAVIDEAFFASHCSSVGYNGSVAWTSWSTIALAPNSSYTLRARVQNSLDSQYPNVLSLDGVAVNYGPTATCDLGVNPNGRPNPAANAGFRQVNAEDADGIASLVIVGGTFTSDELSSGDYVQLTLDVDSAGLDQRPAAGVLESHITTNGQPYLVATDTLGIQTIVPCGPLPPVDAP